MFEILPNSYMEVTPKSAMDVYSDIPPHKLTGFDWDDISLYKKNKSRKRKIKNILEWLVDFGLLKKNGRYKLNSKNKYSMPIYVFFHRNPGGQCEHLGLHLKNIELFDNVIRHFKNQTKIRIPILQDWCERHGMKEDTERAWDVKTRFILDFLHKGAWGEYKPQSYLFEFGTQETLVADTTEYEDENILQELENYQTAEAKADIVKKAKHGVVEQSQKTETRISFDLDGVLNELDDSAIDDLVIFKKVLNQMSREDKIKLIKG